MAKSPDGTFRMSEKGFVLPVGRTLSLPELWTRGSRMSSEKSRRDSLAVFAGATAVDRGAIAAVRGAIEVQWRASSARVTSDLIPPGLYGYKKAYESTSLVHEI
jgi:hypothetical protein